MFHSSWEYIPRPGLDLPPARGGGDSRQMYMKCLRCLACTVTEISALKIQFSIANRANFRQMESYITECEFFTIFSHILVELHNLQGELPRSGRGARCNVGLLYMTIVSCSLDLLTLGGPAILPSSIGSIHVEVTMIPMPVAMVTGLVAMEK